MPEGVILDQIPHADNKIRPNQNVFVTVSKKPSLLQMPDFLAVNVKDIQVKAARSDIDVLYINLFIPYPNNVCFAQYPKARVQLAKRKAVAYISNGAFPLFIVPTFKGFSVGQVKDVLHANDVNLEIVHSQEVLESHTCGQCHVIDQRPIVGSIISFDQPIQIQLSVGE
jgi:beta-lactam-binding protein with PASTA domain